MRVASRHGEQEVGVASGWNVWVWLECCGCCCEEVYRFPHNVTYPYSTCITSFLFFHSCLCYFCAI